MSQKDLIIIDKNLVSAIVLGNKGNKMSNKAFIIPTEFVCVRSGDKSYGVRVFDDYNCAYDNNWESIPDDDLDLLEETLQSDNDDIRATLNFVKENQKGIIIGNTEYTWEQIKNCF